MEDIPELPIKPFKIGSHIVGSDHFDEYNIRIDPFGKASITSIHQQSPRDMKDIMELFVQN